MRDSSCRFSSMLGLNAFVTKRSAEMRSTARSCAAVNASPVNDTRKSYKAKENKMKFLKYTSGECSYIRHGAQRLHAALEVVALCVHESGDACAKQFDGKLVEFRKLIEQLCVEGFVHRLGVLRVALVGLKTKRENISNAVHSALVITAC